MTKTASNRFSRACRGLCGPLYRIKALRRDDSGQVLILSGIMVLMAMIMAITTVNSGYVVYNRVTSQNAVDAAADTYAAYQARGLNFAQHLNDVHYWANMALFAAEAANYGLRIACPLAGFATFPIYNLGLVSACCQGLKALGLGIDNAQHLIAELILGVQEAINVAFPVLGALSANALAEANGADNVPEWSDEITDELAGLIHENAAGIGDLISGFSEVPVLGDIYAVPLKPEQLIDLNIKKLDPDPDYLPWDDMSILQGLVIASDVACAMVFDIAMNSEPSHGYGWDDDTYYCGGPSYNTWLTGKKRRNAWPALDRLPWLNPNMGTPDLEMGIYTYQDGYPVFVHRSNVPAGPTTFRNPAFYTIASSQVGGSPLMERSGHSNFEEYAYPQLISVHLDEPGTDSFTKTVLIWH